MKQFSLLVCLVFMFSSYCFAQGKSINKIITKDKVGLSKWDNECSIEIDSLLKTPISIKGNRKEQENSAIKISMYDLANGDFEYEIILKKKPLTNTVSIPIKSKNLVFYYQPPLTQKDIDDGCYRPENVIGSYAVYHDSKKNNKYKTGKAFHIYRPKTIDADGVETWCEFNTDLNDTGILTITVPQKVLDTGKYPIIIDPTFGLTTIGATKVAGLPDDNLRGVKATPGSSGTLSKITGYFETRGGAENVTTGIYDDNGGVPNNKVDNSAEGTLTPWDAPPQWWDFTGLTASVTGSTQYWIAFNCDANINAWYDTGSSGDSRYVASTYNTTLPDPFPSATASTRIYSIYATYTETAATSQLIMIN